MIRSGRRHASFTVLTAPNITGNFTLGEISADSSGNAATLRGVFSLANSGSAITLQWYPFTPQEAWRYLHFGIYTNTGDAADSADPDGDGFTNLDEFTAGTDPNDPTRLSRPRLDQHHRPCRPALERRFQLVRQSRAALAAQHPPRIPNRHHHRHRIHHLAEQSRRHLRSQPPRARRQQFHGQHADDPHWQCDSIQPARQRAASHRFHRHRHRFHA